MCFLVCEDNYFNYKLLEKVFEKTIVKLDYAEDGKYGLENLENKNYDLILMDLQMPRMNGFEMAKIIRREKNHETPIIAMTANNSEKEKILCFSIGINDYIGKSFKQEDLFNMIINVLHKKNFFSNENDSIIKSPDNSDDDLYIIKKRKYYNKLLNFEIGTEKTKQKYT